MQVFAEFNLYFKRQWMQKVTAAGFSVYGEDDRTNNFVESFNSKLKRKIRTNPSIYAFLGNCKTFANVCKF
jgi:hypothetical protein